MLIATDFLLDGLLGAENFHPSQYAPQPVILRGAEGEVAESINIEVSNII